MKKGMIIGIVVLVVIIIAGILIGNLLKSKTTNDDPIGLANPASVYCVNNSGTLENRSIEAGEYGVCMFDDGSECEEWKYFRNECTIGQNYPATEGTVCTMEYAPVCGVNGVTYSNKCMAGNVQILKDGEC